MRTLRPARDFTNASHLDATLERSVRLCWISGRRRRAFSNSRQDRVGHTRGIDGTVAHQHTVSNCASATSGEFHPSAHMQHHCREDYL